jgi:septum formation protein
LLEQAGIDFDVMPSHFDESSIPFTKPDQYVKELSLAKAEKIAHLNPDRWVIAADTTVVSNGNVLGKPKGKDAARHMLSQLSGRTHQVHTGFTICHELLKKRFTASLRTDVTFKILTADEIEWYIHTGEPFDKAGAYAIQGFGTFLVKTINGSYTNVVGLPVCEVVEFLIQEGVINLEQPVEHQVRMNG